MSQVHNFFSIPEKPDEMIEVIEALCHSITVKAFNVTMELVLTECSKKDEIKRKFVKRLFFIRNSDFLQIQINLLMDFIKVS